MAGLLIRELIARGDLHRCLIVCPGSLADQWQDELNRRFLLSFEIMTREKLDTASGDNWFLKNKLVIARLDVLSRNEDLQAQLDLPEEHWDLVVCDEAHKMSASIFGNEVKYTKRYRLGQKLSELARNFLLMTATPHNGKEEDFQLFMALIDPDRFEGRFRSGVHSRDVSDLFRRTVKENLLTFESKPLFPKRVAETVSYRLSKKEEVLYKEVTNYVREEFNRAEALQNSKRAGTIGFALTILQRRLASSPDAIYSSLCRRRERLENRLHELVEQQQSAISKALEQDVPSYDEEDLDELEDKPNNELEEVEDLVLYQATASISKEELTAEIRTLTELENLAMNVLQEGEDRKWRELAELLTDIFKPSEDSNQVTVPSALDNSKNQTFEAGPHQKLIVFTEHRDTLTYLFKRICTLFGTNEAVLTIDGSMNGEKRRQVQEKFQHNHGVKVLVATDAAGEGINLQCANLMVNYDLPWNPNRLEQRFGRIHRIGQNKTCHLWNLVAEKTREGDVYRTLLDKIETAREALGGQVFDVLGRLVFDGKPLRELLKKAIRFGEMPEIKEYLDTVIEGGVSLEKFHEILNNEALVAQSMDTSSIRRVREKVERAEASRLQPHFIESFFLKAFRNLKGKIREPEHRRYQLTEVPTLIRNSKSKYFQAERVRSKYERIVFEKNLISHQGQPVADFVFPGHPILDSTVESTLQQYSELLRRGAILVDEQDVGENSRVLFYLEHSIRDGIKTSLGARRLVSKRIVYVEMDASGNARHVHDAPYLDYRPLTNKEPSVTEIMQRPECGWVTSDFEKKAKEYAVTHVVQDHYCEVLKRRQELITKSKKAVEKRLNKQIEFWNHRAKELEFEEQAGKTNARSNSNEARRRAKDLNERLNNRLSELEDEEQLSPLPPEIVGGALVISLGLLVKIAPDQNLKQSTDTDTQTVAARAREIIMEVERTLGFLPKDRELEKLGYDIESKDPDTGRLRFIEVKGRVENAATITVTKNEILYSLNKPEDFILAIVEFRGGIHKADHQVHYIRTPFKREPDFGVTSVNYNFSELLSRSEIPQ